MSLRSVILAILSKEPNTGYGVGRLLRNDLHHIWDARRQQIYGELAKMGALGLVTAKVVALPNRPAKKIYSLTPAGLEALDDWLQQRPADIAFKDDLLVQLYCVERLPRDLVVRRLDERRDEYEHQAVELRRRLEQTPSMNSAHLGDMVTLEAALARAESQVAWCVKTLAGLRDGDADQYHSAQSGRGKRAPLRVARA